MWKHWTEPESVFDELVTLDEAARAERLREVGARDPTLAARLEAMLAADAEATARLHEHEAVVARSVAAVGERSDRDPLGLIGTAVGRYHINAFLGAGGMGVVYRAADPRLGRPAALKFLPPAWSLDSRAKQRFLYEARATSSLDHPNVCTIYEADETADGTLYIAMALYEGETLRERLDRGPLSVDKALDLAAQAARGLAAAHAQGLVHRDIKPANLLVTTDGLLKILDFGVAKAANVALTLMDQRPGTAAYMAPEQMRGESVDGRADLWSLGVVLYEMLTGERPAGAGAPTSTVPAPSKLRPAVPAPIDALVLQLLAHSRDERPQRAEDVLAGLEPVAALATNAEASYTGGGTRGRAVSYAGVGILIAVVGIGGYVVLGDGLAPGLTAPAAAASPRFVAVLPFDNLSADPANEFFADGVTDDVLAHLAQVPEFSVISRNTTMGYKGSNKGIPKIADELRVEYVLTGSVQRSGEQVRILAQLVDGRTDRPVWTDSYDRQLEDIFAVQTEIATAIAAALEVELSRDITTRLERPPTNDVEAYELFLVGRENFYRYSAEGNGRAIELFGRALERDPQFTLARAWLGLALAHQDLLFGGGQAWADSAIAEAGRAITEQPDLSDAHGALGDATLAVGRYDDAISAYRRALELNPSDWHAAVSLGAAYEGQNRWDEGIRLSRRAIELDAVRSHIAYANMALYYTNLGLLDRAEEVLERARAVEPQAADVIYSQGYVDLVRGRRDAALVSADRLAEISTENSIAGLYAAQLFVWSGELERARDAAATTYERSPMAVRTYIAGVLFAYTLMRTGDSARGRRVLSEIERRIRQQIEAGGAGAYLFHAQAVIHALRGERDAAFHWLEEAVRSGWNHAAVIPGTDPLLDALHGDPRYQSAMDRMERRLASLRDRVARERL